MYIWCRMWHCKEMQQRDPLELHLLCLLLRQLHMVDPVRKGCRPHLGGGTCRAEFRSGTARRCNRESLSSSCCTCCACYACFCGSRLWRILFVALDYISQIGICRLCNLLLLLLGGVIFGGTFGRCPRRIGTPSLAAVIRAICTSGGVPPRKRRTCSWAAVGIVCGPRAVTVVNFKRWGGRL